LAEHIVSTQWLEDHLDDASVVVLEVSIDVSSRAAYRDGHIPGSHFAFWKDLVWHDTDRRLASPETMSLRLGSLGVTEDRLVALVGDPFQFAAYAYWVMAHTGFEDRCRLVDGGRRTWEAEHRPLTTEVVRPDRGSPAPGSPDRGSRIARDELLATIGDGSPLILDLRSPEEYRGERVSPPWVEFDHGAERRGHVPGAVHLFYEELLDPDGALLPPDRLHEAFRRVGAVDGRNVVTYCRLGHRASLGWFVLTRVLGRGNVRVYDGSWTEWGSMVGMPIERG